MNRTIYFSASCRNKEAIKALKNSQNKVSFPSNDSMVRMQKLVSSRLGYRQVFHHVEPTFPFNREPFYIHDKQMDRLSPMMPGILSRIVFNSASSAYGITLSDSLKKKAKKTYCTMMVRVAGSVVGKGRDSLGILRSYATTSSASDEMLGDLKPPVKEGVKSPSEEIIINYYARRGNGAPIYVAHFLLFTGALVFGMVVLGGLTRLTESGLSMVKWSFTGETRPRNEEEWEMEFEQYQQYPEYQLMNRGMTLEEFKFIYNMEYSHRYLGRFIGLLFLLKTVSFNIQSKLSTPVRLRLFGILGMICGQGFLGWYMVKSGLGEDILEEAKHPRVSPYRLTAHLSSAFAIFVAMLWTARDILIDKSKKLDVKSLTESQLKLLNVFKRKAWFTAGIIGVTVISGAFVAGNDAGYSYNTWPKMADRWIPTDIISNHLALWRNPFENSAMVQFNHRNLAYLTFGTISGLFYLSSRKMKFLPLQIKVASKSLFGIALLQVILGISTLVHVVPVPLASAHQAGSMLLMANATILCHGVHTLLV